MEEQQEALTRTLEDISKQLVSIGKELTKLTEQKEREMSSEFKKLEAKASGLSKELVKHNSEYRYDHTA